MKIANALIVVLMTGLVACSHEPPAYESRYTEPAKTPVATARTVAVIGDGYTIQGPTPFPQLAFKALTRDGIGIDLEASGLDGAGYVNPGPHRITFQQKVPRVVRPNTELVVFVGSRNDRFAAPSELAEAISATYADTMQIAHNARLLVIGPIYPEGNTPTDILQVRDVVRDKASAVGAMFVDPIAEGWLVGDPALVQPDGLHPNVAGNQYLADRLATLLRAALA